MSEPIEVIRPDYATPASLSDQPASTSRPRLLPGVIILALMLIVMKVPGWIWFGSMIQLVTMWLGPMVGTLAIAIWWMFFSRLPSKTRWVGLGAMVVGLILAFTVGHKKMTNGFFLFAMPIATVVWVIWTVVALRLSPRLLRPGLIIGILGVWGFFCLLRLDGLNGSLGSDISFRWTQTKEEKYLASLAAKASRAPSTQPGPTTLALAPGDWPAFRGPERDGRLPGVKIDTNWAANPPKLLWKHDIGPGWSSVCVVGDRLFTQEQRGEVEVAVCYSLSTGEELWSHKDKARFDEAMAGPGPRATPTFHDGKLYVFGATGILNCLNPVTGEVIWTRDVAKETGAPLPPWGFSSSPAIANGSVIVLTGAPGKSLAAYKLATGEPAWSIGDGWSYASPQLSTIAGVEQLVYITNDGAVGVDPVSTKILWQHSFPMGGGNRAVQPTVVDGTDILVGGYFGVGTRRVHLSQSNGSWQNTALWTEKSIKPYYNDMTVHKGHLYGFDGFSVVCVDAATGKRKWRENGYGNGQLLLLPDQDLLLVVAETGFIGLMDAKPEAAHELGRFEALEGKTWNHPVISNGKLIVRNGEQIAVFQLTVKP